MRISILVCSVLCICVFALGCGEQTTTPVRLAVRFAGEPPHEYDCTQNNRFVVSFCPEVDTGAAGTYLTMYFRLQTDDDGTLYQSNHIDFNYSPGSVYDLEFGGAIEGEKYRENYNLVAYVQKEDDSQTYARSETRTITVKEKTNFTKTMHIEYDCQQDWELPSSSFAKLTAAFHVADTDTDFFRDEVALPEECIWWDSLPRYRAIHFSNTPPYNMHLLAIKGLWDNSAKQGITIGASIPGPLGFSFIFMGDIYDWHPDHALLVAALTTVHEFGHQRADLTHASVVHYDPLNPPHPELHDSPFCAMNQDICYTGNNDNDPNNDPPGLKRWFDWNPHFCDMCVDSIKNISW